MKFTKRNGFNKMPPIKKPDETVSMFKYGKDLQEAISIVAERKERKAREKHGKTL